MVTCSIVPEHKMSMTTQTDSR